MPLPLHPSLAHIPPCSLRSSSSSHICTWRTCRTPSWQRNGGPSVSGACSCRPSDCAGKTVRYSASYSRECTMHIGRFGTSNFVFWGYGKDVSSEVNSPVFYQWFHCIRILLRSRSHKRVMSCLVVSWEPIKIY